MSPATLPLQRYLDALHEKHQALDEGSVAAYIPELAKADPEWFGICIVTTDGYAYAVGEADRQFTLQSISKPAVYAAALNTLAHRFGTPSTQWIGGRSTPTDPHHREGASPPASRVDKGI